MAFATLTFCQLFHAFDVRSEDQSIFKIGILSNPAMNKAFLVGMVLQLAVLLVPPLMGIFEVCALTVAEWVCVLGLAIVPVVICEIEKAVRRALRKKRSVCVFQRAPAARGGSFSLPGSRSRRISPSHLPKGKCIFSSAARTVL